MRPLTAVALTAGLLLAGVLPAAADPVAASGDGVRRPGGATATLDGLKTFDGAVLRTKGRSHSLPAGLFEMTVDGGGRLKTYGIDLHNPAREQAKYQETPGRQTSLASHRNAGKIRWILRHSFPQIDDLARLAKEAGTGPLTQRTAAAGTQVAIWRYSDGADVQALDPAAEKLADWLERRARQVGEPGVSLGLEPAVISGKPGRRIGPVTVRTDAERVSVAPAPGAAAGGVKVTDAAGKPVGTVTDGAKVYVHIPEGAPDGTAALVAQTATPVPVGRAFTSAAGSQAQILAHSSESTVSAQTKVVWAAEGVVPALSARHNCVTRGVDVTAANPGDAPFTVEVGGAAYTVAARGSRTVTVPVTEDQPYDVVVTGRAGSAEGPARTPAPAGDGSTAPRDARDSGGAADSGDDRGKRADGATATAPATGGTRDRVKAHAGDGTGDTRSTGRAARSTSGGRDSGGPGDADGTQSAADDSDSPVAADGTPDGTSDGTPDPASGGGDSVEDFRKSFRGVLDCRTAGVAAPAPVASASGMSQTPVSRSAPLPAGDTGEEAVAGVSDGDLAATGGSGITPLIAGGAAVLIVVGGVVLFVLRRRNPAGE
ncbi:thioester domain-containing protein [Streptomyces yaizuensis]|uniref:Thioester domain-containing protein n=1 Tax=Streptomyces yaizuensis TaxID=2989713 RepID=A0ABQ5NTG7_9ACTN|nr:TQXA domain-containing protein [Streptomyces sp. YSPA8]GLF93645.1 hypothetical protein SYYSPA8_05130 [Streptomyces sp. YSPA8]